MERVSPNRLIIRQIVGRDDAAVIAEERDQFLTDGTVIKFRHRRVAQMLESISELLLVDFFTRGRRASIGLQENFLEAGIRREHRGARLDLACKMLADRKAVARKFDRGCRDLLELHGPEALYRRVEARDFSRHGDSERSDLREFLVG